MSLKLKHEQFFKSLAVNLENRLLTTKSSHCSLKEDGKLSENYSKIIENLSVLNPGCWSDTVLLDAQYGEESVRYLCEQFRLENITAIIRAFREFKEEKIPPKELLPLTSAVNTIPISTADCERSFSSMNEIITSWRSSL